MINFLQVLQFSFFQLINECCIVVYSAYVLKSLRVNVRYLFSLIPPYQIPFFIHPQLNFLFLYFPFLQGFKLFYLLCLDPCFLKFHYCFPFRQYFNSFFNHKRFHKHHLICLNLDLSTKKHWLQYYLSTFETLAERRLRFHFQIQLKNEYYQNHHNLSSQQSFNLKLQTVIQSSKNMFIFRNIQSQSKQQQLEFIIFLAMIFVHQTVSQKLTKMSLIFYYHPLSEPSRAVLALLHIANIKFQPKIIDILKGQARTPEYTALNPFAKVPFIIHDNFHLSQSNAILQYLVQTFPQELAGYYGSSSHERAQINQFLSWYQGSYRASLVKIIVMKLVAGRTGKPILARDLAQAQKQTKQALAFLDKHLAKGSPYIVGNHLSIADLLIFSETVSVQYYEIDLSEWTHLHAWYNKVLQNDAVAKIHQKYREESLPQTRKLFGNIQIIS